MLNYYSKFRPFICQFKLIIRPLFIVKFRYTNGQAKSFEVFVFFVGKRSVIGLHPLVGKSLNLLGVHLDFLGLESKGLNQVEVRVTSEGPENPKERLFVLIVGLS